MVGRTRCQIDFQKSVCGDPIIGLLNHSRSRFRISPVLLGRNRREYGCV
jgi:hypothetical protein